MAQLAGAIFFDVRIAVTAFGLDIEPMNWWLYEFIELSVAFALTAGVILGAIQLRRILKRNRQVEGRLNELSGAFMDMVSAHFDDWELSAAERDVALFLIKGLSVREIAEIRNTSEGTVKAQSNAIYRKSGTANRSQLVSHFIDDLMRGDLA